MLPPRHPIRSDKAAAPPAASTMLEQHYSLDELVEKWGYSHSFLLAKFRDQPGVLATQQHVHSRKRTRSVYRVPASVALLVYERMRIGG